MQDLLIYKAEIDINPDSDLEVNYVGLVENPAIEKNFQVFKEHKAKFSFDDEKRIISGAAMIADLPIYRNDKKLGEYYIVFDKNAICTIVQKFAAKGYMKNFNLFHDPDMKVDDVVIFNSFVTDKSIGIQPPVGFENISDGSWFISAKVNNDKVWDRIKSGDVKGFSVEGLFNYIPVAKIKMTANELASRIEFLLNNTEITD